MKIEKIIDYLILKILSEEDLECPMSQRIKIAYIKAKYQYENMTPEMKREIREILKTHERGG